MPKDRPGFHENKTVRDGMKDAPNSPIFHTSRERFDEFRKLVESGKDATLVANKGRIHVSDRKYFKAHGCKVGHFSIQHPELMCGATFYDIDFLNDDKMFAIAPRAGFRLHPTFWAFFVVQKPKREEIVRRYQARLDTFGEV